MIASSCDRNVVHLTIGQIKTVDENSNLAIQSGSCRDIILEKLTVQTINVSTKIQGNPSCTKRDYFFIFFHHKTTT